MKPEYTVYFRYRHYMTGNQLKRSREKRAEYEHVLVDIVAQGIANGEFSPDADVWVINRLPGERSENKSIKGIRR